MLVSRSARLAVLAVAVSLNGCSHLTHIAPATTVASIDFRTYAKDGFLFSPNAFVGDFDPIGMMTVSLSAEGKVVVAPEGNKVWEFTPIDAQLGLRQMRDRVVALGGNAVVSLTIRSTTANQVDGGYVIVVPGLEVSGFAIHRTGADKR